MIPRRAPRLQGIAGPIELVPGPSCVNEFSRNRCRVGEQNPPNVATKSLEMWLNYFYYYFALPIREKRIQNLFIAFKYALADATTISESEPIPVNVLPFLFSTTR